MLYIVLLRSLISKVRAYLNSPICNDQNDTNKMQNASSLVSANCHCLITTGEFNNTNLLS